MRDRRRALIEEQHCDSLRNRRYAEIGVARAGNSWRINLAAPLLAGDLGDWRERRPGGASPRQRRAPARRRLRRRSASPPRRRSTWNDASAPRPSRTASDMARARLLRPRRPARRPSRRARARGRLRVAHVGENIAAGQGSAQQVVAGWLASPGHCANILSRRFAEMGAAYALDPRRRWRSTGRRCFGTR